jgi:2-deoxy-D-gluconate 3-dehydrogenase
MDNIFMTHPLFDISGRIALVTGGGRGIGRMITEGLLKAGARVYISSRKAAACDAAAEEMGEHCFSLPADVSSEAGAQQLADNFATQESQLDILVNNAGAAWGTDFSQVDEKSWDKVINTNLKAPFFVTQKLHSVLQNAAASNQRYSKVINIGSIDGLTLNGLETYSYHASKSGLHHLTRRMAARLIGDNIVVNAIAPGAFASDMNKLAKNNPDVSAQNIPFGRIGSADDISAAVIFLAARAGDYVVGHTLPVDGGVVHAGFRPPGKMDPSLTS